MPYTVKKPPEWLKNLPDGAIKLGVETFNAVMAETEDEEKARIASWVAIKKKYEKGDDGEWRAKMDVSLDDVRNMIWEAVNARDKDCYLEQVYGGYIIYQKEAKFYKVGYSILDGKAAIGDNPVEVQKEWVETQSRQAEVDDTATSLIRVVQAKDAEGTAWEVLICEPGFTKNGWHHTEDVLRDAAGLFEGVDVNLYDLPQGTTHVPIEMFGSKGWMVKNKAGWIDSVRYVAGEGLKGVIHFLDSFKWLGKNMVEAAKQGVAAYGLSYDAPVRAAKKTIDGRTAMQASKFWSVDSVDIVTRPAAGGKFIRAVAAQNREEIMDKKQLWDLITSKRADLLKGKDFEKITDEELVGIARMAMEAPAQDPAQDPAVQPVTRAEMDLFVCGMALEGTVAASGLPVHAQNRIRSLFKSKAFKQEDLDKAITDEKDYLAAMSANDPDPVPASRMVRAGIGSFDKAQMALDKLFGLGKEDLTGFARMSTLDGRPFFQDRDFRGQEVVRSAQDYDGYDGIPQFRSIREAYEWFTGDSDVTGFMNRKRLPGDLRASMDITSATFTYVLGNTLGRRLVKMYKKMDFKTQLLISIKKAVRDFRQQEAVLVGGFPDIETVDPEAADYNEIASVTDEESTYTIGQKGNLLTITRKTIINDDVQLIIRLVDGFARAFARTHGKYVWAFFTGNGTCSDGTAWFTSGHGNLGATALTHATGQIAYTALAKMTEKDSAERVGLIDGSFKLNVVGPVDIMGLMARVADEEFYYSTNDLTNKLPNPLYGKLVAHVIPLLTDTNDWGMLLPPDQIDMVEMGYLNGREEPEFFVADTPQAEQVFVADKIRHKGRHEYAGAAIDYRGGYKAVVA